MHNSLRESFNSHRSKLLLALAVVGITNSALLENLNAQTPNNGGKAGTEMVDKSDTQRVADFTKPLGVTIPAKWTQYASNIIQMLDADGVAVAHMILKDDLKKIPEADRLGYLLLSLEAIRTAYDREAHTTVADSEDGLAESITYENELKSVTERYAEDRQKRSEIFIAQTQQEINQKKVNINEKKVNINEMNKEISQNKQEISQNKQEIEKMVNEAAIVLSKDPNNITARKILQTAKDGFKKINIEGSENTKNIFRKFNIQ